MEGSQRRQPRQPLHLGRGGDPHPALGRLRHPAGGGTRPAPRRSQDPGLHEPARPHRSRKLHGGANRELRENLVQAGETPPQGHRDPAEPPRTLHEADRPRVHRPPRTDEAADPRTAEHRLVRIRKPASVPLRQHPLLCKVQNYVELNRNTFRSAKQLNIIIFIH